MRILMLSYDKTFLEENSAGDVLLRHKHYSEYLDRLDIVVLAPVPRRQADRRVNEKFTIYPSYGSRIFSWLRGYLRARRICRQSQADIVVTQDALLGCLGVILKKEFRCKLNINAFALEIFSDLWLRQSPLNRFYKSVMCWAFRRADLIRTDGTKDRMSLIERLGIPANRVVTIPVTPSPESIGQFINADGDAMRKNLLGDKYDKLVLFVGMLIRQKNIPNLLKAAKIVSKNRPRTLFAISGDGPERDYLERLCQELDIAQNVRFCGLVSYDNLAEYYAACDVFVLPSWYEGFARVLMEAAFARKPIVATNVSGVDDIMVDGETGYIVEVDDSEQLADRIQRVLENPQVAAQMGDKGYQRAVECCDFNRNVEKLTETWRSLLGG